MTDRPHAPDTSTDASVRPTYHPARQVAIQASAAILALSLLWPYYGMAGRPYDWLLTSILIGIFASVFSRLAKQPGWWRVIHLFFAPMAWLVMQADVDPTWFLAGFILLFLLFRGAITGQIPLYLTSGAANDALAELIEQRRCQRFIDLGAGVGSAIVPLARAFPECRFTGVEYSPLTYAIGWLRTRGMRNVDWHYADLWSVSLTDYEIVYAFLSPAPMEDMGRKIDLEMNPCNLFVSNSFVIPDRVAEEVRSAGARSLYCYRPQIPAEESTDRAASSI